ncbi:hypothetical protein ILUMI_19418 [Ignelater luminosus]|uniref:PiggyBac transposable element-derived protein domain-containing protein n=1 Tax=Ignelater luminosus TaxID=2038154 RepID=A0A8K0G390_IGNLU|nr:hypothetical protein ILUMI_19418 [Ignelater luminosus]
MANKRGLSDAELELELLHGLPEDCSDPESNVSDEDLSPASDSDEDFISRPSSSSDSDENLECVQSPESYTYRKRERGSERGISRRKHRAVGHHRDRSSNFISYASEASTSNCSQPESGNATSEVCVTTFHEENGTRPSLMVGNRHVGKDKITVTAHNINTHGRFSAQNVLKEAVGPTTHARRNVTEGSVSKTETRRHGAENWSLSLEELDPFIALLYARGQDVTVDEQLFPSKARCNFTQFIANKPNKFGIKFWMLADVKSKYMCNTFPYLGKDELRPEGELLAENVVIRLMEPYLRTGRNVTTDNFFTSLKLAERLKAMQTSIVGTMKRTRKEIPAVVCNSKESLHFLKTLISVSGTTLTVYQGKRNKNVLVLSTQHSNVSIGTGEKQLPQQFNIII